MTDILLDLIEEVAALLPVSHLCTRFPGRLRISLTTSNRSYGLNHPSPHGQTTL
jgi:hypothetical protein